MDGCYASDCVALLPRLVFRFLLVLRHACSSCSSRRKTSVFLFSLFGGRVCFIRSTLLDFVAVHVAAVAN